MKKLWIAVLLMAGMASFAQEAQAEKVCTKGEKKCPSTEKKLEKMTEELTLTPDQQTQIKGLLEAQKVIKQEAAEKMEKEHTAMDAKLKTILTAEQYTKWSENKKEGKKKCCKKKKCTKDK